MTESFGSSFQTMTDADLERAAASDREAFGVLYERYMDSVYDFATRMLRDREEAADVMQETFIRAMKAKNPERAGAASVKTYLFTIARNLCLNRIERRKRVQSIDSDEHHDGGAPFDRITAPDHVDPAKAAERHESASLVWEAARSLDDRQYSVLDLHLRQGLEAAELASVLNVTIGNAYTILSRTKDAFESAVGSLVLFRRGRRECSALDVALSEVEASTLTPATRRIIEKHSKKCDQCTQQRAYLVRPAALFGALVAITVPLAMRRDMAEAAWQEICRQEPGAGIDGSGGGGRSGNGGASHASSGSGSGRNSRVPATIGAALLAGVISTAAFLNCTGVVGGVGWGGGGDSTSLVAESATPAVSDVTPVRSALAVTAIPEPSSTSSATASHTLSATETATPVSTKSPPMPTQTSAPNTDDVLPPPPAATPAERDASSCQGFWSRQPTEGAGFSVEFASELERLQNEARAVAGLRPMRTSPSLLATASTYAQFFAENDWANQSKNPHVGPDGRSFWDRFADSGLVNLETGAQSVAPGLGNWAYLAENYAFGPDSVGQTPHDPCEVHKFDWTPEHVNNYMGRARISSPQGAVDLVLMPIVYVGTACYVVYSNPSIACIQDFVMFQ